MENDTNLIVLSHLHQKISRLTNNGKNSVFWTTYDVMTYVTWQRQDDVTYAKMCLPSLVTDTMRRFLRLESSKKLQGKNARGWYPPPPPPGVRGLTVHTNLRDVNVVTLNHRVIADSLSLDSFNGATEPHYDVTCEAGFLTCNPYKLYCSTHSIIHLLYSLIIHCT